VTAVIYQSSHHYHHFHDGNDDDDDYNDISAKMPQQHFTPSEKKMHHRC